METYEKKNIDNLTENSVGIITQTYKIVDEIEEVIDESRCAYVNSEGDRERLIACEPEDIVTEVMMIWGDTSTVVEPEYVPETGSTTSSDSEVWDEIAFAITEGVNEV